jgi:Asp-tRNA(Asn)/Glu-tRNA(Gln) amidotransferase A subunit family amidase
MVPLALGTQTGGSVIRPASFCGVHGFKPSFGLISRTGVCMMADWLDTVGVFANSVEDMALIADVLTASDPADPACGPRSRPPLRQITLQDLSEPPRLAFVRTPKWGEADAAAQSALEAYARSLGGICREVDLPEEMEAAWTWHRILQTYGIAQHYGPLLDRDGDLMSPALREQVAEGRGLTEAAYRDAIVRRERASAALEAIFADVDALLTLPAPGPAPRGLDFTGDPVMNAFWTYAGVPCVTLPLLTVEDLPLGVQLVGRRGGDGPLLRVARWLDNQGAAGGD